MSSQPIKRFGDCIVVLNYSTYKGVVLEVRGGEQYWEFVVVYNRGDSWIVGTFRDENIFPDLKTAEKHVNELIKMEDRSENR